MIKIYLKNQVRKYQYENDSHEDIGLNVDLDVSIDTDNYKQIDIVVGKNGVGKSFLFQNLIYLAFLYNIRRKQCNDYEYIDKETVVARLYDAGIGKIKIINEHNLLTKNGENEINIPTTYNPTDKSRVEDDCCRELEESKTGDPDVDKCMRMGAKLLRKMNRYYCFKISDSAKRLFDSYKFVFYSNTHYSSNAYFSCEKVKSLSTIDEYFLILNTVKQKRKTDGRFKIVYWANFSVFFGGQIADSFKKDDFERTLQKLQKKYKGYFNNISFDDLNKTDLLKDVIGLQKKANSSDEDKFPRKEFPLEFNQEQKENDIKKIVLNIYALFFLKEIYGNINFELSCEVKKGKFVPYKFLNSGEKYNLTLDYLKSCCDNKTILFIDEPENSLHLKKQEETSLTSFDAKLCLITHSPAFISNLVRKNKVEPILHLMTENADGSVNVELTRDCAVNNLSLDSVAAEYLGYSPFVDYFCSLNRDINPSHLMSINDFYSKVK